MVPPTPTPTPRLLKAVKAEREQLAQHRRRLLQARESLRAELERIESSLAHVSERENLLDRLVGSPNGSSRSAGERAAAGVAGDAADGPGRERRTVLRGPAIRREAIRILRGHPGHPEALHYRDWYALMQEAGFAAGGKDPLATFLTQLSRSPAVRKSTQAGVYELDQDAPRRLQRRRDEIQDELRELTAMRNTGPDGAAVRARRTELNNELGRVEKALDEVETLFAAEQEAALAA